MKEFKDRGRSDGMSSAGYLRWVAREERAFLNEKYGEGVFPTAAEPKAGMPKTGTIDNFGVKPVQTGTSADFVLMKAMVGISFSK